MSWVWNVIHTWDTCNDFNVNFFYNKRTYKLGLMGRRKFKRIWYEIMGRDWFCCFNFWRNLIRQIKVNRFWSIFVILLNRIESRIHPNLKVIFSGVEVSAQIHSTSKSGSYNPNFLWDQWISLDLLSVDFKPVQFFFKRLGLLVQSQNPKC